MFNWVRSKLIEFVLLCMMIFQIHRNYDWMDNVIVTSLVLMLFLRICAFLVSYIHEVQLDIVNAMEKNTSGWTLFINWIIIFALTYSISVVGFPILAVIWFVVSLLLYLRVKILIEEWNK